MAIVIIIIADIPRMKKISTIRIYSFSNKFSLFAKERNFYTRIQ